MIGAVLALAGIAADAFLVSGDSGNDDNRSKRRADLYPAGGKVPARELTDLRRATAAAGCELRSVKIRSRAHVDGAVVYPTRPPTGGNHFGVPADDGIYTDAPQRRRSSTVSSTGA